MKRETWSSRAGFVFAAAGSAVGLANIWRFPYMVGTHGGGVFIVLYLLCLFLVGFPIFVSEALIGKTTTSTPSRAFKRLGESRLWGAGGKMTIFTGWIVSAFYSAVAGWIFGYLIEAFKGNLHTMSDPGAVGAFHDSLMANAVWTVGYHALFILVCAAILFSGVRGGIERGSKILMPMLYAVLLLLVGKVLLSSTSWQTLSYLMTPDWSAVTPSLLLVTLGQAFFTLSLGQGTMVTYGSYLTKKESLLGTCLPVALMDTFVSLFAAIAVFGVVFAAGLPPDAGPSLLFQTLPLVFNQLPAGYFVAILFFLLVFLAAITSEISALEPSIAYLIDEWRFTRTLATFLVVGAAFLLGIPCALSTNVLYHLNFLGALDFLATGILIPIGGFLAIILVGWKWGITNAMEAIKASSPTVSKNRWLQGYLHICIKYLAPIFIVFVFLNAIGLL